MANVTEMEVNWTRKMEDFENRLKAVCSTSTTSNPTVVQLTEEFQAFKKLVSNMFALLRQQVNDCTRIVDCMDMRQRQKVLLLRGIPEDQEVNIQAKVVEIIHNKLGLPNVSESSLKRCHRLGSPSNDRARAILLHFHDYKTKSEVWRAKSKLKATSLTLTEFLTRIRHSVHIRARKHFGMKNVWTLDGVIHVKVPGGGHERIVSVEELDALVKRFPCDDFSSGCNQVSTGDNDVQVIVQPSGSSKVTRSNSSVRGSPSGDLKRPRRQFVKK